MEFNVLKFLEVLIFPPGGLFILAIIGFVLLRLFKVRWGLWLVSAAFGLLYLLSMPLVANGLMSRLEHHPPLNEIQIRNPQADAIVVLAGGRLSDQPEYGGDTVSAISLQRLRYGAWLKRRTQLPLYVSGGSIMREPHAEAELMRDVLQKEFNVAVDVVENKSKTTYENAKFTAGLLKHNGHQSILLVSNAFHMPRAIEAFQQFDINVIAAPTVFLSSHEGGIWLIDFLPQAVALKLSSYALHEFFGRFWYKLRYY
jgi:uncharacterized SAM-binding protein YcdF (DUF218 family)